MMNPSGYTGAFKDVLGGIQEGVRNWDDRRRGVTERKLKELQNWLRSAEGIVLPNKRTILSRNPAFQHLVEFLEKEAPVKLKLLEAQLQAVKQSCFKRFKSWLGRTVLKRNELDSGLDELKESLENKVQQLRLSSDPDFLGSPMPTTNIPYPLPEMCPLFGDRIAELEHFIVRKDARMIVVTTEECASEEQSELTKGAEQFTLLVAHLAELNAAACEFTRSCPAARALLSYFTWSQPHVCWLDASLPEGCLGEAAVKAVLKTQFEELRRQLNLGVPDLKPLDSLEGTIASARESIECWHTFIVLQGVNNQVVLNAHARMCTSKGHHLLLLNPQLQLPAADMVAIGLDDLLEAPFHADLQPDIYTAGGLLLSALFSDASQRDEFLSHMAGVLMSRVKNLFKACGMADLSLDSVTFFLLQPASMQQDKPEEVLRLACSIGRFADGKVSIVFGVKYEASQRAKGVSAHSTELSKDHLAYLPLTDLRVHVVDSTGMKPLAVAKGCAAAKAPPCSPQHQSFELMLAPCVQGNMRLGVVQVRGKPGVHFTPQQQQEYGQCAKKFTAGVLDDMGCFLQPPSTINTRDGLTMLRTHDAFWLHLKACVGHCKPLCLALLDLDDFTRFNDINMLEGDRMLQSFGNALHMQDGGPSSPTYVFRYGGDEFALVSLYDDRPSYTTAVLKERQLKLLGEVFSLAANLGLTFSCGCTILQPEGFGGKPTGQACEDLARDLFLQTEKLMKEVKHAKAVAGKGGGEYTRLRLLRRSAYVMEDL